MRCSTPLRSVTSFIPELDDLLVDREEIFVKFKPIRIKSILGARIIEFLANIGDNWNADKGRCAKNNKWNSRIERKELDDIPPKNPPFQKVKKRWSGNWISNVIQPINTGRSENAELSVAMPVS